jgi:hypothetical protein
MVYFETKNPNWVNVSGPWNGKGWYILWILLRPFGTFWPFCSLVALSGTF